MEDIVFEFPECHVFRLPPTNFLVSAQWEGNQIWSGAVRVVRHWQAESKPAYAVELWDLAAQVLFGRCPLPATPQSDAFQVASDSSRSFVIRVEQGEQFAYVGVHFQEKGDAVRFCAAVSDRFRFLQQPSRVSAAAPKREAGYRAVRPEDRELSECPPPQPEVLSELRASGSITVDLEGKLVVSNANSRSVGSARSSVLAPTLVAPSQPRAASTCIAPPPSSGSGATNRRISAQAQLTPSAATPTATPAAIQQLSAPPMAHEAASQQLSAKQPNDLDNLFGGVDTAPAQPAATVPLPPAEGKKKTLDDLFGE